MAGKAITLGAHCFPSLKEARSHFTMIKESYTNPITPADGDVFAFLIDVYFRRIDAPGSNPASFRFSKHVFNPNARRKEYGVIITLENGQEWIFPGANFGLNFDDRTRACPKRSQDYCDQYWRKSLIRHMRLMIEIQMDYSPLGDGNCVLCGAVGEERDHYPTGFAEIVDDFLADYSESERHLLEVECDPHDRKHPMFTHQATYEAWFEFHLEAIQAPPSPIEWGVRWLCKPCHHKRSHEQKILRKKVTK